MRYRAEALYAELDVLREPRPRVKAAMVAEGGARPGLVGVAKHSVPGSGARGAAHGHDAHTVAVSHEAEPVGL